MKTSAAILWETNARWSVEEIELDAPQAGEVLVEMKASGMCHSDEHLVTGDLPFALPIIGGHEGAGIVRQVGEGVSWLAPGDHVFLPARTPHTVKRTREGTVWLAVHRELNTSKRVRTVFDFLAKELSRSA